MQTLHHSWFDVCFQSMLGKLTNSSWYQRRAFWGMWDSIPFTELCHSMLTNISLQHPELRSDSNKPMELDVFLPRERLAFEYQGQVHFEDIYSLGILWKQKEVDARKRGLCKEKGITLIEVPYWWDRGKESLAATIQKAS
jgi:hypothetical protein